MGGGEGSLQPPKKPGDVQVCIVVVGCIEDEVVVEAVVVTSLQPNQPGVLQVEVDVEVVVIGRVVVASAVVLSSKQPHHPGVWHVAVLVLVAVDVLAVEVVELLFPSTSFHSGQSWHSGVNLHSGTVS